MATRIRERLLTADEFLLIRFAPGMKAELDNGEIRMMAGGSSRHDQVQTNLLSYLRPRLRGSGCRPSGSDMAIRTHGSSIRYPDVSIHCGHNAEASDGRLAFDDPRVVIELLSPGTAADDRGVRLAEYKALPSVDTIALIDLERERLHVFQRTGPRAWAETDHLETADLHLPALGLTVPHEEMFARD